MSGTRQPSAVVDLNLFVSGIISELGLPRRLIIRVRQDAFVLVLSRQLRDELDEVLRRQKLARYGLTAEGRAAFFDVIDARAVIVRPSPTLPLAVRDRKDEIVLATALGGSADYLVTGDADLLTLKDDPRIGSLRIVTVREFLEILEGQG
jgi:putative PIN family toxin of toxin-antitoxin system